MSLHDAYKTVADLRDHLARHDKPIAFLFGAGTSCSVATAGTGPDAGKPLIPAVAGLTDICQREVGEIGKPYADAWVKVADQCSAAGRPAQIEEILSRLRMMLGAMGASDILLGLDRSGVSEFEKKVRQTIAKI